MNMLNGEVQPVYINGEWFGGNGEIAVLDVINPAKW